MFLRQRQAVRLQPLLQSAARKRCFTETTSKSNAHPGDSTTDSAAKMNLLDTSLKLIPTSGFTQDTFVEACNQLGWSSAAAGLCPRGPIELVDHFLIDAKSKLRDSVEAQNDFKDLRVTEKIIRATETRLMVSTSPIINHWPHALALMAVPENVPNSIKHLADLVDEIWFLAGDNSVDLNWYSKRMLLAAVYSSTELFMTTDKSDDFEDTRAFLRRRIKDVGALGKSASDLTNVFAFGASQIQSILRRK